MNERDEITIQLNGRRQAIGLLVILWELLWHGNAYLAIHANVPRTRVTEVEA